MKIFESLSKVFDILSHNNKLSFKDYELFSFSNGKILTPIGDVLPLLFNHKSKLKDQFIDIGLLNKLTDTLTNNQSIVRLNHIGFCYKATPKEKEKERLIGLMENSKFHLYQEPSNDDGLWFFIGNADNWEESAIEIIPIEKTNDQWVDYWLPHIHIDIDTTLNGGEIKNLVKSIFGKSIFPFPIIIDGVTYIIRNRLGTVDGVNLTIDLATNSRDVKYSKQNIWKKIV
jgi:hypothetical protein